MRLSIATLVAGLLGLSALGASVATAWPWLTRDQATTDQLASAVVELAVSRAGGVMQARVETAQGVARRLLHQAGVHGLATDHRHGIDGFFRAEMTSVPYITGIEYVAATGEALSIDRSDVAASDGFRVVRVSRAEGRPVTHVANLDPRFRPMYEERVTDAIDPRLNGWYQQAASNRVPFWWPVSSAEPSANDPLVIIRPHIRANGDLAGVARISVDLNVADGWLPESHDCACVAAFLADGSGRILSTLQTTSGSDRVGAFADIASRSLAGARAQLAGLSPGEEAVRLPGVGADDPVDLLVAVVSDRPSPLILATLQSSEPAVGAIGRLLDLRWLAAVAWATLLASLLGLLVGRRLSRSVAGLAPDALATAGDPSSKATPAPDLITIDEIDATSTAIQQAIATALDAEERRELAFESLRDGLFDVDLTTGRTMMSNRLKEILFLSGDSGLETLFDVVHAEDRDRIRRAFDLFLDRDTGTFDDECRLDGPDHITRWIHIRIAAVRSGDGRARRMVGVVSDVTVAKETEARLLHEAFHDVLTDLPNRVMLIERMAWALDQVKTDARNAAAVIAVDLDSFRVINDNLGQGAGDDVLVTMARRLRSTVGPSGFVARIGSDQFAVLASEAQTADEALALAYRLRSAIHAPLMLAGQEVFPTASVGVALCTPGYQRAESIMSDADLAMAKAKERGRGQVALFERQMRGESTGGQLALETDMRRAHDQRQFLLYYQPIVDLSANRVAGFEALMRWRHPIRGLVPPMEFIPSAEALGLIVPMGAWAIEEAVRQLVEWTGTEEGHEGTFISINVSRRQLDDASLLHSLSTALSETGIAPNRVHLELTESLLMEERSAILRMLDELKGLGVRLSIDDFGTGYSSLGRLHRLPFDVLKIDRSFVADILTNQQSALMVRSIVDLAHALGMDVVAEGAETPGDVEALREAGCELCQGYVYARPMMASEAGRYLALHQWTDRRLLSQFNPTPTS